MASFKDRERHLVKGAGPVTRCGVRGGGGVMRKVSLIAAGLVAFGLTAARAEVGTTDSGGTANTRPPPANVDVNVTPPPASDVDVKVKPPATTPPGTTAPGTTVEVTPPGTTAPGTTVEVTPPAAPGTTAPGTNVEVTPSTPADVDVNINPPPPPPPVAAPTQQHVMPPA